MEQSPAAAVNLPAPVWIEAPETGSDLGPAWAAYPDTPPNLDIRERLQNDLFWPVPSPATPCKPEWKVFFCGCSARVAEVGCNRLDCRNCADFLRRRRATAIGERMEAGRNGKPVIYTVFTIPPDLREKAANKATWGRWMRALRKVLKKKFGLLYGCERVDPCGDEKPDVWHPHLNLLWVQRDGWRPFIDVDALREEWARIIGTEEPNLWTQFSTEPAKLGHWYSYMGRTWSDWRKAVPNHLTVRWIGKYPARPPQEEPVCDECGQKVEDLSFLSSTKEVAEFFCRAGPAACRAEVIRRRHVAYVASQRGGPYAPWLIHSPFDN